MLVKILLKIVIFYFPDLILFELRVIIGLVYKGQANNKFNSYQNKLIKKIIQYAQSMEIEDRLYIED